MSNEGLVKVLTTPTLSFKNGLRLKAFRFLEIFGEKIRTKLDNVCGKTGQYNVPDELFQKRTSRNNRCLISWKAVRDNNLNIVQLDTFEGGVAVEFVNNDFFDNSNYSYPIFSELIKRIGSDDNVSAIISIRSEDGSSSSQIQREAFKKLISNTEINYKGEKVIITEENYNDYAIKQTASGGKGNEKWSGFLYICIRGGQQDTIETHKGVEYTIFNPACEYASRDVLEDLNLVSAYFALVSIDMKQVVERNLLDRYHDLMEDLVCTFEMTDYDSDSYKGNLLDYVYKHPSISLYEKQLTDPIQLKKINIDNFSNDLRNSDSIDFTHSEAVNLEKYYWDRAKKCILSPARPTNIFWSLHLSNMMQQDFTLEEYFEYEKQRYETRMSLLKKSTS